MKKTVIFGGTFDPPHLSHEQILSVLNADNTVGKILIVPTKKPVHKVATDMAGNSERKKMCEIVAKKFDKAEVWDTEITRAEKSYTYYTLTEYKNKYGDIPYFVMGADMLVTFSTWYKYHELIKLCRVLAVFRKGENKAEFLSAIEKIKRDGASVTVLEANINPLSSTLVRERAAKKESLENLVSPQIEEYILKHNLYTGGKTMTVNEYKNHIQKKLGEKRYFHSLCVAEEAVRLADRYGADKEKAYIAGLLHDVLKDTSAEEQLKFAKEFGIILSDLEFSSPKLYHSIIGSVYIEKILGIDDAEITSAVRYHTTAKENMTLLQKVLYLADYTSRDRDYDGVQKMRKAVDESMEKAMKIALEYTVTDLENKGETVHPDTLAAYRQYAAD